MTENVVFTSGAGCQQGLSQSLSWDDPGTRLIAALASSLVPIRNLLLQRRQLTSEILSVHTQPHTCVLVSFVEI
jgi:hypothetical protein